MNAVHSRGMQLIPSHEDNLLEIPVTMWKALGALFFSDLMVSSVKRLLYGVVVKIKGVVCIPNTLQ